MRTRSTAALAILAVLLAVLLAATAADARGRRRVVAPSAPAPAESGLPAPTYPSGRPNIYSTPPGYRGIIRADTPNQDGNFGGPSAGGLTN